MRNLGLHVRKAVIRNDLGSAEVLELGSVSPGFGTLADQFERPLQAAIVVGSDIRYKIGGVIIAYKRVSDFQFHSFS